MRSPTRLGRVRSWRPGPGTLRAPRRYRRGDVLALAAQLGEVPRSGPRPAPPETPEPGNGDIGAAEVARILGVSRATVLNWADRGMFPAIKDVGESRQAVYRFERSDINAFVEPSRLRANEDKAEPATASNQPQCAARHNLIRSACLWWSAVDGWISIGRIMRTGTVGEHGKSVGWRISRNGA